VNSSTRSADPLVTADPLVAVVAMTYFPSS
jgi:hypothetical protein